MYILKNLIRMNDRKTVILIALIEEFLISNSSGNNELKDSEVNQISEILEVIHQKSTLNPEKIKKLKNDDYSIKQILNMIKSLNKTDNNNHDNDYYDLYQDFAKYVDYNVYTDTIIESDFELIDYIIDFFEQNEDYEKCGKLKQAKNKIHEEKNNNQQIDQ